MRPDHGPAAGTEERLDRDDWSSGAGREPSEARRSGGLPTKEGHEAPASARRVLIQDEHHHLPSSQPPKALAERASRREGDHPCPATPAKDRLGHEPRQRPTHHR